MCKLLWPTPPGLTFRAGAVAVMGLLCDTSVYGVPPSDRSFLEHLLSGIRLGSEDRCAGGRPKKGLLLPSIPDLL